MLPMVPTMPRWVLSRRPSAESAAAMCSSTTCLGAPRFSSAAPATRSAGAGAARPPCLRVFPSRPRCPAPPGTLGTIGNTPPFVGLFGTVLGIIRAFRDIGQVGAAGPAVVAAGISEALIATAAGLFVAISAVIVYNVFIIWQGRTVRRAEIVASEMLNLVAPEA